MGTKFTQREVVLIPAESDVIQCHGQVAVLLGLCVLRIQHMLDAELGRELLRPPKRPQTPGFKSMGERASQKQPASIYSGQLLLIEYDIVY